MRQWKIAFSLAIVPAAAAPFALHTYKMPYPQWRTWTPLTTVGRQQITINLAHCTASEMSDQLSSCGRQRKYLDEGGFYAPEPSVVFYLLLNGGCKFWCHFCLNVFAACANSPLLEMAQRLGCLRGSGGFTVAKTRSKQLPAPRRDISFPLAGAARRAGFRAVALR
jgi:hypothetical protein